MFLGVGTTVHCYSPTNIQVPARHFFVTVKIVYRFSDLRRSFMGIGFFDYLRSEYPIVYTGLCAAPLRPLNESFFVPRRNRSSLFT